MWQLVDSQTVTRSACARTQWSLLYNSTYLSCHGSLALGNDCRVGMVSNASGLCGVLHHCSISISTAFNRAAYGPLHVAVSPLLLWGGSHLSVARLYLKACTVYRITQWFNLSACTIPKPSVQVDHIFKNHRTLTTSLTIMCTVVTIYIQCTPLEHLTTVLKVNRASNQLWKLRSSHQAHSQSYSLSIINAFCLFFSSIEDGWKG